MDFKQPWLKICGLTSIEDALLAVELGANVLGLNLIKESKRYIEITLAQEISKAVRAQPQPVLLSLITSDLALPALQELMELLAPDLLQLHDRELRDAPGRDSVVQALGHNDWGLLRAYRAFNLRDERSVQQALTATGSIVLVDAAHPEHLGGSGQLIDVTLAKQVSTQRPTLLAGGLNSANVGELILTLKPAGVDVASGVEVKDNNPLDKSRPPRKDPKRLAKFISEAKAAFLRLGAERLCLK